PLVVFALVRPVRRAAEHARRLHGNWFAREQGVEGIAGIMGLHRLDIRVVDPAVVAQLAYTVEDKHLWRGQDAIGDRGLLRRAVVQVREAEVASLGPELHLL